MEYRLPKVDVNSVEEALESFLGLTGTEVLKMRGKEVHEKTDLAQQALVKTTTKIRRIFKRNPFIGYVEKTGGDVHRLQSYKQLEESISYLQLLYANSRGTRPAEVMELEEVFGYLKKNRKVFMQGFKEKNFNVMSYYSAMVLAVMHTTNACIMTAVEIIKQPSGLSRIQLTDNLQRDVVVRNISTIGQSIRSGRSDTFLKESLKTKVDFAGEAVGIVAIGFATFLMFLWIIRDVTYYFFASKNYIANYLEGYSHLLELHASTLPSAKGDVAAKQRSIAEWMRNKSEEYRAENESVDKRVVKEIQSDTNKELVEVGGDTTSLLM